MLKTLTAAGILAAAAFVGAAQAEPADGTTLAGGNNGADAKATSTMQAGEGSSTKGSPAATPAPGQSTQGPDGKMRSGKNF